MNSSLGSGDPCWVCGSTKSSRWKERSLERALEASDLAITDSRYGTTLELRRCADCGFIFAGKEELKELVGLYERLEDPGYVATQDTRALQMEWLLGVARRTVPKGGTWLDIGAGAGLLVAAARAQGWQALGIEPSRSLVEFARASNGVEILQGIFPHPDVEGQRFDVISLVDVIEHVSDPVDLLSRCRSALSPGGVILCVTPDVRSIPARLLGRRWWHFRLAHVGYFDRSTLALAADRAGLAPLRWMRARWFFRLSYLVARLARYLPIGSMVLRAQQPGFRGRILEAVVPVDLRDSWVVFLGRAGGNSGGA